MTEEQFSEMMKYLEAIANMLRELLIRLPNPNMPGGVPRR